MARNDLTSFDIGMPAGTPDPVGEDMDILLDVPDASLLLVIAAVVLMSAFTITFG